jgi:hypothetical protein
MSLQGLCPAHLANRDRDVPSRTKIEPANLIVLQSIAGRRDFDQSIAVLVGPELDEIRQSATIVGDSVEHPLEAQPQVKRRNAIERELEKFARYPSPRHER